jgi:predicted ATPase
VLDQIMMHTDGVPLFIEELTKTVLESDLLRETTDRYELIGSLPPLAIPTTLHASLLARLDRLATGKNVAQIGATIGRVFSYELVATVSGLPEKDLTGALGQLIDAELVFQRGAPPDANYQFKHTLVQDAAYGTLLREPRRALHGRIAETLESQFPEIAESQPELLAHHCTEAGLIEKAATLWGKAGQRSLERSALFEAAQQLRRALAQIALLPTTPALRREQIKLQVCLVNALMHVKGYAEPETIAAGERARLLIEQAEALGEPPEDPLLLFSVLFGIWVRSIWALTGNVHCQVAAQLLELAEKQKATVPLMIAHRVMGVTLVHTGEIAQGRAHLDRALALYNPAAHRPLAMRFGQDIKVAILTYRSWAQWFLGYPEAALADKDAALKEARIIGHAATLMFAPNFTLYTSLWCGDYASANMQCNQLVALAEEKGAFAWMALGKLHRGCLWALTGQASDAVPAITSAVTTFRSSGAMAMMPWYLSCLARAHAELGQFGDAWRCSDEAMATTETTKERQCEAEIYRMAGEIALMLPQPDAAKAEAHFGHALAIARKQQAKSWELRAAMSMARLWRDQGRPEEARDLLAPVYSWFTQGFDTGDLKQAKAILDTPV